MKRRSFLKRLGLLSALFIIKPAQAIKSVGSLASKKIQSFLSFEQLDAVTKDYFHDELADNYFRPSYLLRHLLEQQGSAGHTELDGGSKIRVPLNYE